MTDTMPVTITETAFLDGGDSQWIAFRPAVEGAVSLRSVSSDNFVVQDVTREPRIVAEVDYDSAPATLQIAP